MTDTPDPQEGAMPQVPLFSEYPASLSRPRSMQDALDAGRAERARAAAGFFARLRQALAQPFRRRQTVAVPPSGIRVVVCNDC